MESTSIKDIGITTIQGIQCFEASGIAYLNLEAVARGLGFIHMERSGNGSIRWDRVKGYLKEFGYAPTSGCGDSPQVGKDTFIPENIFYRLAMKAKNEAAEKFQAKIADEIIPQIRKTGMYLSANVDSSFLFRVASEMEAKERVIKALTSEKISLLADNAEMKPKADYYDELVDTGANLTLTEAARVLGVEQELLRAYCIVLGEMYHNRKGQLVPAIDALRGGNFVLKHCVKDIENASNVQTLVTPKGMSAFRNLFEYLKSKKEN